MRALFGIIILAVMNLSYAQTNFRFYRSDLSYRFVRLPVHTLSISRFRFDTAIELIGLRIGFINEATENGKADILIYKDDDKAIPSLEHILSHMKVSLDPKLNATTLVHFPQRIHFEPSSTILVAIIPRSESLTVRMDETPQQFLRTTPDTLASSLLAFLEGERYIFSSNFIDGSTIGNWHVELLFQMGIVSSTQKQPRGVNTRTFAQRASSNPPTSPSGLRIAFSIPERSTVRVEIKTLSGEFLRTILPDTVLSAGLHLIEWDKKDQTGTQVDVGSYELNVYSNERIALRQNIVLE